jgi:hypothetical protein
VLPSRPTTSRYLTALVLTVIYHLITMSPLAPVLLKDPRLAHALTGECAGDCDICGCSLEQRANRTCCCQQKLKQKASREAFASSCCNKQGTKVTVIRCSCPCGSEKAVTLLNLNKSEILPFAFASKLGRRLTTTVHHDQPRRMPTRLGEPPDPPPHLSQIS